MRLLYLSVAALWLAITGCLNVRSSEAQETVQQTQAIVQPAMELPNIVFVLADDLGYGDLSCYNAESGIETVNLDRMARNGMRFTDAHSGWASCIPSRYALLTGRFGVRMGRGPRLIPEGRPTLASLLRGRGYTTAMVGKWHLGFDTRPEDYDYEKPFTGGPLDCGFDSFFGMHASLDIQPYFYMRDRNAIAAPDGRIEAQTSEGGEENWNSIQGEFWREGDIAADFVHAEVTPRFFEESIAVIENHADAASGKPLFLYVALPSPHTPWLPTEEFQGKSEAGMYGDFVLQVDDGVGRIVDTLRNAGMLDNSLVVFSSDNGPVWYEKDVERFGHDSTGGLRGMKFASHEGGHRMPFLVQWQGQVPEATTSAQTIVFSDVLATLDELTGGREAASAVPRGDDGVSFLPYLLERGREPRKRSPIVHDRWTLRDGDWKLILPRARRGRRNSSEGELYNLKVDLQEEQNLFADEPETVELMSRQLEELLNDGG